MKKLLQELRNEVDKEISGKSLENEIELLINQNESTLDNLIADYLKEIMAKYKNSTDSSHLILAKELNVEKSIIESFANRRFTNSISSYIKKNITKQELISDIYYYLYSHEIGIGYAFQIFKKAFHKIAESSYKISVLYHLFDKELNPNKVENENIDTTRLDNQILIDTVNKLSSYLKIKDKIDEHNDELNEEKINLETQLEELKHLRNEKNVILAYQKYYTFQTEDLFTNYMFGYDMNVYRGVYYILDKYGVLRGNMTFPFFLHKMQINSRVEDKLLLQTKDAFNAELLGCLFNKLKQHGLDIESIGQNFNFYGWFVNNVEVEMKGGKTKPLPDRYIINIRKEEKLTPTQQDILLEIEQIFI